MARAWKRKSAWERDPEKRAAAERVLRESRGWLRDPARLLREVADGKVVHLPRRSEAGAMAGVLEALQRGDFGASSLPPDAEVLHRLLLDCRKRTDLLIGQEAARYAGALAALSAHEDRWVRRPETWRPQSHSAVRQFRSLVRHLIAQYHVPDFMDSAWLEGPTADGVLHQGWYIHVAQGGNLRTAQRLPVPLTKRQAHLFLQAPDDFDVVSAFRWAQIRDLGGSERLVRSILETRLGATFGDEAFWASVFRYLIAHPEIPSHQHGPIIDFVHGQKFTPSILNPQCSLPGEPLLVPPQPNLCMKGRSPESLLRALRDWHAGLARAAAVAPVSWEPSGIPQFVCEEESGDESRWYGFVELLSTRELIAEGEAMHHCVASYARACASRRTSIWSLRAQDRAVPLVTLEVNNFQRRIVQAKRRWNRRPTDFEHALLARWGAAGGPVLAHWLTG